MPTELRDKKIHPVSLKGEGLPSAISLNADIVIVGAGIAGLATALALHRTGLKSLVLEGSDSLRTSGTAIGLWANAWRALRALGVGDSLQGKYTDIDRAQIFYKDGSLGTDINLQNSPKQNTEHELRCVDRLHLLEVLAHPLPLGTIRFNSTVVSIHQPTKSSRVTIRLEDGTLISTKVLIGCDGIRSVVSSWMRLPSPKLAGYYTIRGVATFPGGHNFDPIFQQFLADGWRAGLAPIDPTKVYWFISNATRSQVKYSESHAENSKQEAVNLVHGFPKKIIDVVHRTQEESVVRNTIRFRSLLWRGKLYKGTVTVAGDAMHAMPPDLAQGGCCALEDAVILARYLANAMGGSSCAKATDFSKTERERIQRELKKYARERRSRAWELTKDALMVGKVLNGESKALRLLRDRLVLPNIQASSLVDHTHFDCGTLHLPPPNSSTTEKETLSSS